MALNIDYFDILPTDRWLGGAGVYWLTLNSSALMIEVFMYFHLSVGKPFWLHLPGGCICLGRRGRLRTNSSRHSCIFKLCLNCRTFEGKRLMRALNSNIAHLWTQSSEL